jgi:hypothetical protein
MDPQTTWDELLAASLAGDWDRMDRLATALLDWLDRDGLPPIILSGVQPGLDWDRALARAGCQVALDLLQSQWRTTP